MGPAVCRAVVRKGGEEGRRGAGLIERWSLDLGGEPSDSTLPTE